jgi:hypothetical protein
MAFHTGKPDINFEEEHSYIVIVPINIVFITEVSYQILIKLVTC